MKNNIKAVFIKNNKPLKSMYNIKSVVANKKYNYFEVTQVFYKRDIISLVRFTDCDRVELYKHDENYYQYENKPYKVVNNND